VSEAAGLLRLAVAQGAAGAQLTLGGLYYEGTGVSRDHAETARLWRLAADQGNAAVQCLLGRLYSNGDAEGVPLDYVEAARLFGLAAAERHADAQFHLGGLYDAGAGVTQDYAQAARSTCSASTMGATAWRATTRRPRGCCGWRPRRAEPMRRTR
jgi:hypothetical protein